MFKFISMFTREGRALRYIFRANVLYFKIFKKTKDLTYNKYCRLLYSILYHSAHKEELRSYFSGRVSSKDLKVNDVTKH